MAKKKAKAPGFKCVTGDCIKKLKTLVPGSINLAIADPPYNIGYDGYDGYDDKRPEESYLYWMSEWLAEIYRVLHKTGSFWLAINDEYVAAAEMMATRNRLLDSYGLPQFGCMPGFGGFHKRSHVIWYYTFGVAAQKNFSRSHTHWLYFTKQKSGFYFNDKAVRVPSQRELVYGDKRAKKGGKQPDNTWILTRDELAKCFGKDEDTWLESRVAGTFGERVERSGTKDKKKALPQMPEAITDRIIQACARPGDSVIDPFLGTGTTGVSAVRHGCEFWGCDINKSYVDRAKRRIKAAA